MPRRLKGGGANPVWLVGSDNEEIDTAHPLPVDAVINGGSIGPANPLPVDIVQGSNTVNTPVIITQEQSIDIVLQPTITAGAYAAGDALGGLLTFANAARVAGSSGRIVKVVIVDDDLQLAPIDIVFFNQTFTNTADNAPFDPSDADLENCIGYVDVAATDYAAFADNSVACKASGLRMPFDYDLVGTSLFAQMVEEIRQHMQQHQA